MNEKNPNQSLGAQGERLAEKWLRKNKKFKIIERNWRSGSFTELDLIALDKKGAETVLVAIEVKTRRSTRYGRGVSSITRKKLYSLKRSFLHFKRLNPDTPKLMRVDAVDVLLENPLKPDIRYYRNIVSA
jgi:putative endonuclease